MDSTHPLILLRPPPLGPMKKNFSGKERKQPTSGSGTAKPKGATTCRIEFDAYSSDVVVTFLLVPACHMTTTTESEPRGAQTRRYRQARTCAVATRDPLLTQAGKYSIRTPESRWPNQYRASQPAFPYGLIKWHQAIPFLVVIETRPSTVPSDQPATDLREREYWFSHGQI